MGNSKNDDKDKKSTSKVKDEKPNPVKSTPQRGRTFSGRGVEKRG